ncbi:MAG: sulfatase [Candidatus Eisenbacteria bacterium]
MPRGRTKGDGRGRRTRVLLLLLPAALSCSGGPEKPANLLLVTVDTERADRLGCYGAPGALTPVADRLAREGVLFTNAFTSIPITLPAHCSILTGLYPRTHGVLSHGYTLPEERTTLSEILKGEGFRTAAFISSHVLDDKYGTGQGFDIFWKRYNYGPKRMRRALRDRGEDLLTQAALDWARLELDEPFFLWLHWFHPHKPYEPPPPMDAIYDPDPSSPLRADVETLNRVWRGGIEPTPAEIDRFRRLYQGEVAFTDRQLGMVLERLEEMGVLDRTLVVYTADHGEVLYEHDRYFGHDIMLYDPSIRVPLLVRAPGAAKGGTIVNDQVRQIDLLPGILDLLGVHRPDILWEGRSFAPALRGEALEEAPIFAEVFPPKPEWKSPPRHGIRYGDWKLITVEGEDGVQLFDLAADPGEERNLADEETAKSAELQALLLEWMASTPLPDEDFPELTDEERENLRSLGYLEE